MRSHGTLQHGHVPSRTNSDDSHAKILVEANSLVGPEGQGEEETLGDSSKLSKRQSIRVAEDELADGGGWDSDQSWLQNNRNAYGAFVHVALQSGLGRAFSLTGLMLVTSMFVQTAFAKWLINTHWNDFTAHQEDLCQVPFSLTVSASFIFITLMLNEASGMMNASLVALFSTHHVGGDGDTIGAMDDEGTHGDLVAMPIHHGVCERLIIFTFGAFGEIYTWSLILTSGLMWICTSSNTDLVIRSTVSIMFVLNVDELIYETCCPMPIIDDVEETKYRVPNTGISKLVPPKWRHFVEYTFGVYIYLILLISCAVSAVLFARLYMTECDSVVEWKDGSFWREF